MRPQSLSHAWPALLATAFVLAASACVGVDEELTTTDFFPELKDPGPLSSAPGSVDSTSATPGNSAPSNTPGTSVEEDCEDFAFPLEDMLFRISRVQVVEPGTLGRIIGSLVQADVRRGDLHVLLHARDFGPYDPELEGYPFLVTGNAGENVSRSEICPDPLDPCREYSWDPDEAEFDWFPDVEEVIYRPAVMRCDGSFVNLEPLDLIFPAILPEGPLAIPLESITMTGQLEHNADGAVIITDGELVGAIREEEAVHIDVPLGDEPRSLAEVLSGVEMNFPAEGPDAVGWILRANVRAQLAKFHERVDLSMD